MDATKTKHVYEAIAAVMADLAKDGIGKSRINEHDRYRFRGIDDVYNALAPALAKHRLVVLPRVLSRESVERSSANGRALFYVTVQVAFDFVSAVDGSVHTVMTYGEAMDRADKATNKAMSAAYKYAAMQAFCIPTEGDNDADATTHEVVTKDAGDNPPAPRNANGAPKVNGRYQMSGPHKTMMELHAAVGALAHDIEGCSDIDVFDGLLNDNRETIEQCERDKPQWYHSGADYEGLSERIARRRAEIFADAQKRNAA